MTQPYQRADDVGYAITEFLWSKGRPFYPVSALAHARVSEVNLASVACTRYDDDNLDLIFQMPKSGGGHFFEIVLRSNESTAYGGWAWGEKLSFVDRFVNGYRVLTAFIEGQEVSFEYSSRWHRYRANCDIPVSKSLRYSGREVTEEANYSKNVVRQATF
ncbi:hypothetical protein BJF92_15290 [Rhizobium rhizosphaerae]|uniref:Uncharacterized protein n=2 Tax=Xaviernesmea rhizosphaerae TaxID=1672749 RepID=A0A1Q9AM18_9HYPH|nr:hypothetical protein BJF92_15290 [Xaviernesmea rhizosphaerae]